MAADGFSPLHHALQLRQYFARQPGFVNVHLQAKRAARVAGIKPLRHLCGKTVITHRPVHCRNRPLTLMQPEGVSNHAALVLLAPVFIPAIH